MFQTPKTLSEILPKINIEYFLPAIQREFVWSEEQIIDLFDSMLKGFPIGSFLFWQVSGENSKDYDFYNFIKNYKRNNNHNEISVLTKNKEEFISILDGQQRITSILIGLDGSYSDKDNIEKFLHINLTINSNMEDVDDIEENYDLKFLTIEEAKKSEFQWFKVSDIVRMEFDYITDYIIEYQLNKFGRRTINALYKMVHLERIINYYLDTSKQIDKVLNIFVRINSGGTHLSYADLLLSVATSKWRKINAREEINYLIDEVNNLGDGFKITKDFILKTALYLIDRDMKFKVANFTEEAMHIIEDNWEQIKVAIMKTFEFLSNNGFYSKNFYSNYPATIIAYYIYKNNYYLLLDNESEFVQFIYKSLLKGLFSSSLDSVLSSIRKTLQSKEIFKVKRINDDLPMNKKINFNINDIRTLLEVKETQNNFLLVLSIIYERRNNHVLIPIVSKSKFNKKDDEELFKLSKTILNHQFITKEYNSEILTNPIDILENKYILGNDYLNFFETRKKYLEDILKNKLY